MGCYEPPISGGANHAPMVKHPLTSLDDLLLPKSINSKLNSENVHSRFLEITKKLNNWHVESARSSLNILISLYSDWINENRFIILSKGHASLALYTIYLEIGIIDEVDIKTFGQPGSKLQPHPEGKSLPGILVSTGSLGQGLSIAAGLAFSARIDRHSVEIAVVIGDGELDEGQVWEAAATISSNKLDNIIVLIDRNHKQLSGDTESIKNKEPLDMKWEAFGWYVLKVDGSNKDAITDALMKVSEVKGKPKVIIVKSHNKELFRY
ncbi:MAG: 1-deoxy-D-xylulose-5-phosphate synthase N-terminal domain-containing protein [Thermoprotei archaeon]